jgi:hypothetical protein
MLKCKVKLITNKEIVPPSQMGSEEKDFTLYV